LARSEKAPAALPAWISAGGDVFGRAAVLTVAHRDGKRVRRSAGRVDAGVKPGGRTRSPELLAARVGDRLLRGFDPQRLAAVLTGVGHAQRLAILAELLRGPGTYQQLVKATGQASGPLYHHVNKLRLAGMVRPAARDLYELTPRGEDLVLALMAVDRMFGRRRSP
jgi:DNA-binding HxlR family transcriptional regulator